MILHPKLAERSRPSWAEFLASYDPRGQLNTQESAVIRHLYQVLRAEWVCAQM
jgi:hypothetical protein